jgi:lipopolysaccharide export LptBFGC system permease protein LptF
VAIFALGLAGAVRRLAAAVAVSMATLLLYWSFLASIDEAVHAGLSRTIAAWLPNLLFLLAGALMLRYGSRIFRLKPEAAS